MSKRLALLLTCAAACFTSLALADDGPVCDGPTEPMVMWHPTPSSGPRSTGFPWRGRLPGGVALREGSAVRHSPHCAVGGRFYGTPEIVQMLERSAHAVGTRLTVGELSTPGGGRIIGHRSHENGRDADVAFYLRAPSGGAFENDTYLDVRHDGHAQGDVATFDDARNWRLVRSWLESDDARVQYVFVASYLRVRLLAEAQRQGASAELIARATHTLMQPPRGDPHRDHFHVRVYCAASDRPACRDKTPYWPWFPALSAETGGIQLANADDWAADGD